MNITGHTLSYPPERFIGAELATHRLLKALADEGHDVHVECTDPTRVVYEGIKATPMRAHAPLPTDVLVVNAGIATFARNRYAAAEMWIYAHNNRLAALVDIRQAMQTGVGRVIANTNHMADVLLSTLSIHAHVLYPPVKVGRPARTPGADVGIVNLNTDKGGDIFYRVAEANPHITFRALKGGHGTQVVKKADNVIVHDHGDQDDFWKHLSILLVPSVHESFGMVGVEAQSRGIPTISTITPGLQEALGDGGMYVLDRTDITEWSERILEVTTRPELPQLARANARHIVKTTTSQLESLIKVMT